MADIIWITVAALAIGYGFGSIPFGLLLTRLGGLGDIRTLGSGNIGATNVLRTGNKTIALLTLLLDMAKGAGPVLLAIHFSPDNTLPYAVLGVGAGAVIGHVFPLWLRFKGGKGVATLFGVVAGLCWPGALLALATWLLSAIAFRMSSAAALVALIATPTYVWWFYDKITAGVVLALAILAIARHRENISRLIQGNEPRIEFSKKDAAE